MKNLQPPEKRVQDLGQPLVVHSIFYTIQGEGPFSGTPAVFIRLSDCNLQCPGCDTEYTSSRMRMQTSLILSEVSEAFIRAGSRPAGLVVITGGEPFRQNLEKLIRGLTHHGYYVQIETNGTLPPPDYHAFHTRTDLRFGAYIVCSPKTGKVHPRIEKEACCYKYVMAINSVDPEDGLPIHVLDNVLSTDKKLIKVARPPEPMPVYLQPMDEQDPVANAQNLRACINSCMKFGYILQLQTHKLIGMP